MNFFNMVWQRLRYGTATTLIFFDDAIDAAIVSFIRALVLIFGAAILGTFIGYWVSEPAARWIYALAFFFGGIRLLILSARMSIIATVIPSAYRAASDAVHSVTEALPGIDGITLPTIPEGIIKDVYRYMWAVLASLLLVLAYAIVFPVYREPLMFLIVGGAGWMILYAALSVISPTSVWLKRYCYGIIIFGVLMIVAYTLAIMFPGLWASIDPYARVVVAAKNFNELEALADTNYWMRLLYFIAVVGLLIGIVIAIFNRGRNRVVPVAVAAVALLFLIFMGERTVHAVMNARGDRSQTSTSFSTGNQSSSTASVPIAKSVLLNEGQGPYYTNPDNTLVEGESYKFPNHPATYMYQKGTLHWVSSEATFLRTYGCKSHTGLIIDCHRIYAMPTTVKSGDDILKGKPIS